MKYLLIILLSLPFIAKANRCDTVPSGVPQLFGGKYYKFNGYTLTDSFIMNAAGDTNNIPYYPSLKFKSADNRWYGWDRSRWQQFIYSIDTSAMLSHYINSVGYGIIKTGQSIKADTSNPNGLATQYDLSQIHFDPQTLDSVVKTGHIDSATAVQFGVPGTGFVQENDGVNHSGTPMVIYPFTSKDTSTVTPRRVDFFKTITNNYDGSQPLNTITEIAKFGSNNLSDHYFRIAFEQNFFGGGEFHGFEYKLNNIGAAIRGMSGTWNWNIPDLSTLTFRSGQFAYQPALSDTQMLAITPNSSKFTVFRAEIPEFYIQQFSTDGTKGGIYMNTHDNQTYINYHYNTVTPTFHTLISDLPGTWVVGCARSVALDDPEFDFRFSNTSNNRFVQWKRGSRIMGDLHSDLGGLDHWVYGGSYTAQMSNAFNVKTYRSYNQKSFGVAITNSADSILFAPISTDTLGKVVINVPNANDAWQDGLLFLSRSEQFQVYGSGYFSGKLSVVTIDSAASPVNMLWQVPGTGEIKKAAVPVGITSINGQTGTTQTIVGGTGVTVNSAGDAHTISINSSYINDGTYTPTITAVSNVSATTAYQCQYTLIGTKVHVSGKVDIDPTATGTFLIGISLPISSAFGNDFECAGTAGVGAVSDLHGIIRADATNDRAELQCTIPTAASINNNSWYFEFLYNIIGG